MAKRTHDRPVADLAAEAKEDLGAGAPAIRWLARADDDDVAIHSIDGEEEEELAPGQRLDDLFERPADPRSFSVRRAPPS